MAFNLNKLVQPECGAPNPLVAAAQQIATIGKASGATPMTSLSRLHAGQSSSSSSFGLVPRQPMNFSKEFAQQAPPPKLVQNLAGPSREIQAPPLPQQQQQQLSHRHQMPPQLSQHQHQYQHPHLQQALHPMMYFKPEYSSFMQQQQQANQVDVADRLEHKFRNDLLISDKPVELEEHRNKTARDEAKVDDVEFWQTLSQTYMGPSTYSGYSQAAQRFKRRSKEADGASGQQVEENEAQQDSSEADAMAEWLNELEAAGKAPERLEYVFDEKNPFIEDGKSLLEDPYSEGLKRLEMGDIPSAALLFEAAVKQEPEKVLAWQYLGTTQAANEKDRAAIRALERCLHLEPNNQVARLAVAASLVNEARYREACEHLLEWLARHERYGSGPLGGTCLEDWRRLEATLRRDAAEYSHGLSEQQYEFVRDKFVQAARLDPKRPDPEVQNSLGVIFNMWAEYGKAVDCFRAALSVSARDSLLWNRLGATLSNWNKSDEAVMAYKRALEISPGFLRSRYNLAISLIHMNMYEESARQLLQILSTQAAGEGPKGSSGFAAGSERRVSQITSTSIWNTLRTVATLTNKPHLYPMIEQRQLELCKEHFFLKKNHSNQRLKQQRQASKATAPAPTTTATATNAPPAPTTTTAPTEPTTTTQASTSTTSTAPATKAPTGE